MNRPEPTLDKVKLIKNMTENLPMLRKRLGLTQEEIADKIGVSRSTVIAIENNKREMTWNTFLSLMLFIINGSILRIKYPDLNRKLFNFFNNSGTILLSS